VTLLEKSELCAIFLIALSVCCLGGSLPATSSIGTVIVWVAGLSFSQSLVRDLILVRQASKKARPPSKQVKQCLCLESVLGVSVLLVGSLLLFSNNVEAIELSAPKWGTLVLLTLLAGFLVKNFILTWRPLGIRREKDHINIIVKW
jgi:hypothetical protein